MPLTQANLQIACEQNKHTKKGPEIAGVKSSLAVNDVVQITIKRKPAIPEQGLRYLPIMKAETDQLQKIKQKIEFMVSSEQSKRVFTEEIRDFVNEITSLEFEFPRHLMEPLFHLINEKLVTAMQNEDIYNLELLLDSLAMIHARNQRAERVYTGLAEKASKVAVNLMKAINMEIHNDNDLLKILVDNLQIAKKINMRGEVIDIATTLKALCSKLLQEMLQKTSNSDDEDDPTQQVYVLKEDDLNKSVYDTKYDKYIEYTDANLSSDLEPILAQHPFKADYLKMSNLNLNFTKKNHALARRALADEETYSLLNIYTRCSFMLTDGGTDSFKSLAFNNAKDDKFLRFARLLFRYRLNLDQLFQLTQEPQANQFYATARKRRLSYMEQDSIDQVPVDATLKIEDFPGLSIDHGDKSSIQYSAATIAKPLTRVTSVVAMTALKFNQLLCEIQKQFTKINISPRMCYKSIRTLFETFIIQKGNIMFDNLSDEFYLQLFRQANFIPQQNSQKELSRPIFLVMTLMSKYLSPSAKLLKYYLSWLERKSQDRFLEKYVKLIIANLKIERNIEGRDSKLFVCWPPSITEIEALDKGKPITIQVVWPTQQSYKYTVDEASTIESLLNQKVYKEKYFQKERDKEFYWLYAIEEDETQFPKPISKEKKILKILYLDEKAFEDRENELSYGPMQRRQTNVIGNILSKTVLQRKRTTSGTSSSGASSEHEKDLAEYPGLVFYLRKRLFSSLHSIPNFKVLQNQARNFLYCQIRQDYVEREILQKPEITIEDAVLIAALCLKVKYQAKMLRSKDNTLTKDIIKKNLDYCVPKSLQKDKSISKQWEIKILTCFDKQNLKDLQLEEAQEQFLTLMSSYKFLFASYYVVKRKPFHGSSEGFRKVFMSKENHLGKRRQLTITEQAKMKKERKRTEGKSEHEKDSESEEFSSSESVESHSLTTEREDDSSSLDQSMVNKSKDELMRNEILEELFPLIQTELLMVITYETILFLENGKRDNVMLEIKHEELLYVMGKRDILKIGFQTNNDQLHGFQHAIDRSPVDIRTAFLVQNARVVAEDIIGYCQLNLVEKTKSKEHIEIIKRNVFDMFEDDGDGERRNNSKNTEEANLPGGQTVIVDDNLLRGKTVLKQTNSAQALKDAGNRAALQIQSAANSMNKDFESTEDNKSMASDDDQSDKEAGGSVFFGAQSRNFTPMQIYEREIAKMSGHQFRFKRSDFLVYMRRHPAYVSSVKELPNRTNVVIGEVPENKKDEVFALHNHTIGPIDEESENSHTSLYSGRSGQVTPGDRKNGKREGFPTIKVDLYSSAGSRNLDGESQGRRGSRISNTEAIQVIPEDKHEHRASLLPTEESPKAVEQSPEERKNYSSQRASTPPPRGSIMAQQAQKQAKLQKNTNPITPNNNIGPPKKSPPPMRNSELKTNTMSFGPGHSQSTQQLVNPKPAPAFSIDDFMAAANKPTMEHLGTEPEQVDGVPGSSSQSPSKMSVRSVNKAFDNIDKESVAQVTFEKVDKKELKGNLSRVMSFLPPPPPPPPV